MTRPRSESSSRFTTKEIGKGTGLGWATVYGIITRRRVHHGRQHAGKGTTFTVYLPKGARQGGRRTAERRERRTPMRRGLAGLHVLVVEDESALRRAFERMLVRLQCEVTMVSTGKRRSRSPVQRAVRPTCSSPI